MIYKIDKTDGSVVVLGPIGQGAAGIGHAMDFDVESETMYLSTYNSMSFENTLRIADLVSGNTSEVGDVENWTGIFAVKPSPPLDTDFSANKTSPCKGSAVKFTDESQGATSWSWVFEGGLPSTSAYQNPTVIYKTLGDFDVELTASNGLASETKTKENYISVVEEPAPEIKGTTVICKEEAADYFTVENTGSTYEWTVTGGEIISGESTNQITVLWGAPGDGTVDLTETTGDDCSGAAETLEVTIEDCVGLEENEKSGLHVYPNPATDILNITSEILINSIRVFDFTGKEISNMKVHSMNLQINTSQYKSGIYLLVIETETTKFQERIVIE